MPVISSPNGPFPVWLEPNGQFSPRPRKSVVFHVLGPADRAKVMCFYVLDTADRPKVTRFYGVPEPRGGATGSSLWGRSPPVPRDPRRRGPEPRGRAGGQLHRKNTCDLRGRRGRPRENTSLLHCWMHGTVVK